MAVSLFAASNFNGILPDVRFIALFMAEINLSFTAACASLLQGCSSETRAAQSAPKGPLPTCRGLCYAVCTSELRAFQSEYA